MAPYELPQSEFDPAPQLTIGSNREGAHTVKDRQKGGSDLEKVVSKIVVYDPSAVAGFPIWPQVGLK